MTSIFTKIIQGEIPSYKVYEDEYVIAFLDINPIKKGHTLVVPKKEVCELFSLDEETYRKTMDRVRYVAQIIKAKTECDRVCMLVEGFLVPHAHVHLVPTNSLGDMDTKNTYKASHEELESVRVLYTS
jgi:histidine triad (HIT) family protein